MKLRSIVLSLAACLLLAGIAQSAFAQEADLVVSKSGPSTATAGSDVSFDVMILNLGEDDAVSVTLDDPLPGGMTFVSEAQNSGPSFICSTPAVGMTGSITCTIALMPAGSSADFTFVANIPPATPMGTNFTNQATGTSQTFDPNDENNTGTTSVTVPIPQADLGVQKLGPSSAGPDTDVSYALTVVNNGPDMAGGVSLSDTLPGTMTFVSINQNSGPAFICTGGATTTCTIASLNAGTTATFTLTGHIPPGTPSGTPFENTATISSNTSDPDPENNSSLTQLVVNSSDLAVTKSGPATANAGGTIAYTITVSNGGPDTEPVATLNDPLPAGTTFASFVQNTGPAAICVTPAIGTNGSVTCTISNFGSGASATFT
ncbi:MAG: hypothetical protein ACREMY_03865, partial [bacterium]